MDFETKQKYRGGVMLLYICLVSVFFFLSDKKFNITLFIVFLIMLLFITVYFGKEFGGIKKSENRKTKSLRGAPRKNRRCL